MNQKEFSKYYAAEFDKSISDDRKNKDDFDYLKPERNEYVFYNGVLIFSHLMNEQMKYLRNRIPLSIHDELIKKKLDNIILEKTVNLAMNNMFASLDRKKKQQKLQTFYT